MFVYILLVLAAIWGIYKYDRLDNKDGMPYYIFLMILATLVSGLRYKIGADTINYIEELKYIPPINDFKWSILNETRYEIGFVLYVSLLKFISTEYLFFQLIHATIINSILFYIFYKWSRNKFTTVLLYFTFIYIIFNTEIIRESLAVCLFLLSIIFYRKNNWILYFSINGLAVMMHNSAYITFLVPFLKFLSLENRKVFFSLFVLVLISSVALWETIFPIIMKSVLSDSMNDAVNSYMVDDFSYNLNGIIGAMLPTVILPLCIVYTFRHFSYANNNFVRPLLFVYIILGLFSQFNSVIFYRFQNYFIVFFLIYLADLFYVLRIRHNVVKRNVLLLFISLILFFTYYKYGKKDIETVEYIYIYERYFPYKSYITK